MWKKHGKARQVTDDNTIQRMRFVCWIIKATDTLSEYIMLINFPRQHWLQERASTQTTVTQATEHNDQTYFVAHRSLSLCAFNRRRLIHKIKYYHFLSINQHDVVQ